MTPVTSIRPRLAGACLALALAALTACAAGAADPARVYPRLGVPGAIMGDGPPYILYEGGPLATSVLDAVSRFDVLILDASPVSEYRPDILAAIRQRNPDILALAYVLGNDIWDANMPDSLNHFPTRYNHLVRDLGGYLYSKRGVWMPNARVNLAKRDAFGRYVVAEAVANLFADAVLSTGIWNGMFVDVFCNDIDWCQTTTDSIDHVRAGYPDLASFRVAWKAGSDTLASVLRRRAGPAAVLVGNCGQGTKYGWFNGWTRENFPLQNGGTWYENMFRAPGGYFTDDANFREPTCNVIFTPMDDLDPFDANDRRRVRFGLGSATLGEGIATFGPFDRIVRTPPHETWWYDEYAVDLATGRSSPDIRHTGWLGHALGAWYQMTWVGTAPDAVTNPGFEASAMDGWWEFHHSSVPMTIERDTTDAMAGAASAHITLGAAGQAAWYAVFATTNSLNVTPNVEYAATFWAKASQPRMVTVAAAVTGSTLALREIALDTQWRRYQVVLVSRASGPAQLHFQLAAAAGEVWLDDVHFQQGTSTIYRRDFENGIVLVNPTATAKTVPLGQPFRRILGTVDPFVNDGGTVTQVTVGASDALFLIGGDIAPPAPVQDLRITR